MTEQWRQRCAIKMCIPRKCDMWQSAAVLRASICDIEATETEFNKVSKTGIKLFRNKMFTKSQVKVKKNYMYLAIDTFFSISFLMLWMILTSPRSESFVRLTITTTPCSHTIWNEKHITNVKYILGSKFFFIFTEHNEFLLTKPTGYLSV